jgi:phosphatidylserine/phosphatidylglycerophosphate/cardiolipin synthase-like enzyme
VLPNCCFANPGATKQQSLDEWRSLTASNAPIPRVFVKGDQVRFLFTNDTGLVGFNGHWSRLRVPTGHYHVHSALLHWDEELSKNPKITKGWREAVVIAGSEWRQLATNLVSQLAPAAPGHAASYQAFLSDRLLYRDTQGFARLAPVTASPKDLVIEHRYSLDETLEVLARLIEEHLMQTHPQDSLFVLMAPDSKRFTQPLLLDRRQKRCVFLAPAALYDNTDRGFTLSVTAQGLVALLPESHGIALIKNPISSAARLVDLAIETVVRFFRFPLPRPSSEIPPLANAEPMDLAAWESWLDRYTGTRRENGSLQFLIDGDQFFSRLGQAISDATNYVHMNVYIFDKDDVAVGVADQLKRRSSEVEVKLVIDRMGSIGGGASPPATPMPEDFVPPNSIISYLREDSRVGVRTFLNPWFSSDHSKVIVVDGARALMGGMNIGREYRYEWHDLMVELTGPVVSSYENEFRHQWAHAGALGDLAYAAAVLRGPPTNSPAVPDPVKLRRLPTATFWKPFAAAVLGSLRNAHSYVYVENPYIFDKRVIIALVRARNRGVDVRVVLPCVNDFKAGGRSNLVLANYLLEHGVRVYFYPGMTHVKALLVDGWSCVGSGNLNHLSLRVNQEQNLATSDPRVAERLKQDLFEADFARSYEMNGPLSVDWVDVLADMVLEGI